MNHWSPKPGVGSSSLSSRAMQNRELKGFQKIEAPFCIHAIFMIF